MTDRRRPPSVDDSASPASSRMSNAEDGPSPGFSAASAFQCNQCTKVFNRRENLSRHLKTHITPSHHCSKCGKSFTRSDLLKRHEAGHERWEKKDSTDKIPAAKRKRVVFETPPETSSHSTWTLEDQEAALALVSPQSSRGLMNDDRSPANSHREFASREEATNFHTPNGISHHPLTVTHPVRQNSSENEYFNHGLQDMPPSAIMDDPVALHQQYDFNYSLGGEFDFSSYLVPPDSSPPVAGQQWFSTDFYSAMRETGNEWETLGPIFDTDFLIPTQEDEFPGEGQQRLASRDALPQNAPVGDDLSEDEASESHPVRPGRISRISSPPNEASEEDKWPFHWNPHSVPILVAKPIVIPGNHPLLRNHDPRYDISEVTLQRIRYFLKPPTGREFHQSHKGNFTLPDLPIVNVFIRLFFQHFSPQAAVLHHPTVNTNTDLPPALLAAMIVIGSIYSHMTHSRRFAIVLLDTVRWHLQIALECDNGLMRDPKILYAQVLICHTGLWCGNKRSFELAEVVRGAIITYTRRLHFHDLAGAAPPSAQEPYTHDLNAQWRQWVKEESDRRLFWMVYALDGQFSSLLNLPSTVSIGEVGNSGCPCDEEFWCATSARNWKNLLGPASIPPSRSFHCAVGPFVLSNSGVSKSAHPILDLNPWSAFLVLTSIQNQVFCFTQDSIMARNFLGGEDHDGSTDGALEPPSSILVRNFQVQRRQQLADSLAAWSRAYSSPPRSTTHATSKYFHASAIVCERLSTMLLDIDLTDIQNAIGKAGAPGIAPAMANFTRWAHQSPAVAENVAFTAVETIVTHFYPVSDKTKLRIMDSAPYSYITLFLCHVTLFIFARVSTPETKARLVATVANNITTGQSQFLNVLKKSMEGEEKLLFKCAAETLTQVGTWGVALNLALLLHRRADMP